MLLYTNEYTGLIPIHSKNMYWLPKTCKMIQGVQGVLLFGYKLSFKSIFFMYAPHTPYFGHLPQPEFIIYFPTSPNYSLSQKWLHIFFFSAIQKMNTCFYYLSKEIEYYRYIKSFLCCLFLFNMIVGSQIIVPLSQMSTS